MLSSGPDWKVLASAGTPSGAESARRTLEGAKGHIQRDHELQRVKCVFHVHSHDLDLDTLQMFLSFCPINPHNELSAQPVLRWSSATAPAEDAGRFVT